MYTGYRGNMEVDLDDLEGLFDHEVIEPPIGEVDYGLLAGTPDEEVGPLDVESVSTPDSTDISTVFSRACKTVTPFVLSDLFALSFCGLIAQSMLAILQPAGAGHLPWVGPIALLPLIIVYAMGGLYSEIWVHPIIELRHLTHINTIALLAAAAGGVLVPGFPLWCAAAWVAVLGIVPLARTLTRHFCASRRWWGYPTLVIGSASGADALARALLSAPRSGLRPILLTDPSDRCRASVMPVMNDPATLESIVRTEGIRHAVVSLPDFSASRLADLLDRYGGTIPHLMVLSDASTIPTLWGASRRCGRLTGIEVRNGLLLATLKVVKRAIDLSIALAVLILCFPVMLLVAIAVKLTSPGPILFGHTRIGRHGRPFKAWKFRSMYMDADAVLRNHLELVASAHEEWVRDHKLRRDPRVTRVGHFLRRTSLDELPQIWNVLKGDMSLVGPRPIVEKEVARYGRVFKLYTSVKPGITGLWQVSGRNDLGYEERVALDQFYVRHWSPWLDIYILARTIITLLKRDGAY